jgi:peptidylprolyl isomerase/peptidyl-prolyl cis-trans isomerase-like 1
MKRFLLLPLPALCLILAFIAYGCGEDGSPQTRVQQPVMQESAKSRVHLKDSNIVSIDSQTDTSVVTALAVINTSMGKITIGLFGKDAPITVRNFIGLAEKDYYDGVLFHRAARNFLIQTVDKNTKFKNRKPDWGKGGESIFGKYFEDELDSKTPSYRSGYLPGVVAMANRGPNTNTSQFFICLEDAVYLEHKWTIFGRVLDGMDVVENISELDVEPGPYEPDDGLPRKAVKILSVRIKKL